MTSGAPRSEIEADAAVAKGDTIAASRLLHLAVEEVPGRMEGWMKLAMVSRATGDIQGALKAISGALRVAPYDYTALLTKASLLDIAGQKQAAAVAYGHALAQRPRDGKIPAPLIAATAQAERRYAEYQRRLTERLLEVGRTRSATLNPDQRRLDRFCTNIARTTRQFHSEPTHFHYPGLPELEFHDPERFAWMQALEASTEEIRQEFKRVFEANAAEITPYVDYPEDLPLQQWKALNRSQDWTAIHLLRSGERIEANARHCPRTLELMKEIPQPQVPGRSPNAMFSLLAPGTRIPPHTGVANTRLVAHLPLVVPEECGFRVGAETRDWEVGKGFVFDDTIEHEAWNDSADLRVVLIFDVWHWALGDGERQAVADIMTASDVDSSASL